MGVASRTTAGRRGFDGAGSMLMERVRLLMYSLALSWYLSWPGIVDEVVREVVIEHSSGWR